MKISFRNLPGKSPLAYILMRNESIEMGHSYYLRNQAILVVGRLAFAVNWRQMVKPTGH